VLPRQRIIDLAAGYEDANALNTLRADAAPNADAQAAA